MSIFVLVIVILSLYLLKAEHCDNIQCSNIFDPICGVAERNSIKIRKTYQNICHFNQIKCKLRNQINLYEVPDSLCDIKKPKVASARRVKDFSIMGAHEACNHTCPTYCVDTYEPACARIWTSPTKSKQRAMINHCHIDMLSCAAGVNVTIEPIGRCYKNPSALLFMMQVAALKSLDLLNNNIPKTRRNVHQWSAQNRLFKKLNKYQDLFKSNENVDTIVPERVIYMNET